MPLKQLLQRLVWNTTVALWIVIKDYFWGFHWAEECWFKPIAKKPCTTDGDKGISETWVSERRYLWPIQARYFILKFHTLEIFKYFIIFADCVVIISTQTSMQSLQTSKLSEVQLHASLLENYTLYMQNVQN